MKFYKESVFIITGAGSGIGRCLTKLALSKGGEVVAIDKVEASLHDLSVQLKGQKIKTVLLDVGDAKAIEIFAKEMLAELHGQRLVLINNAGVALASGRFADTPLTDFEWLLKINLWGLIAMTKAFLPYMLSTRKGHIVNIFLDECS